MCAGVRDYTNTPSHTHTHTHTHIHTQACMNKYCSYHYIILVFNLLIHLEISPVSYDFRLSQPHLNGYTRGFKFLCVATHIFWRIQSGFPRKHPQLENPFSQFVPWTKVQHHINNTYPLFNGDLVAIIPVKVVARHFLSSFQWSISKANLSYSKTILFLC